MGSSPLSCSDEPRPAIHSLHTTARAYFVSVIVSYPEFAPERFSFEKTHWRHGSDRSAHGSRSIRCRIAKVANDRPRDHLFRVIENLSNFYGSLSVVQRCPSRNGLGARNQGDTRLRIGHQGRLQRSVCPIARVNIAIGESESQ